MRRADSDIDLLVKLAQEAHVEVHGPDCGKGPGGGVAGPSNPCIVTYRAWTHLVDEPARLAALEERKAAARSVREAQRQMKRAAKQAPVSADEVRARRLALKAAYRARYHELIRNRARDYELRRPAESVERKRERQRAYMAARRASEPGYDKRYRALKKAAAS